MAGAARFVGAGVRRVADGRLLRGGGGYVGDLRAAGALEAVFVRSPHAHARLREVALPAGELGFTAAHLEGLPPLCSDNAFPGARDAGRPVLARDRVRFAGEPVAVVLAADRYTAEDLAERVVVDYEPLPAVASVAAALAEGAPAVHEGVPGNLYLRHSGGAEDGLDAADVLVRAEFRCDRSTGLPIENRGVLAVPERSGRLTVWSSTQVPHLLRDLLAACLRLPGARIRVVAPDVGGGFGLKCNVFPEEVCVAALALRLGRPVRWLEDRRENLTASAHAREQVIRAAAGMKRDGSLTGLRLQVLCDTGAYGTYPFGPVIEPLGTPAAAPGPYRWPAYRYETLSVATHKCPVGPVRGVSSPLAAWVCERLLDRLAAAGGLGRWELRRRNLIGPDELPRETAGGARLDAGDYPAALEEALRRAGDLPEPRAGRRRGVGVCCCLEGTGRGSAAFRARGMTRIPGYEGARVWIDPTGSVRARLSSTDQGQGHATAVAQLIADALGVSPAEVAVEEGDTDATPYGSGAFASRSIVCAGGAAVVAADRVRRRVLAWGARLLEVSAEDLTLADGRVCVRGATSRSLPLQRVAAAAYRLVPEPDVQREVGLDETAFLDPSRPVYAYATHVAVVDADPETGEADIVRYAVAGDCGRIINPALVDGQVMGGAVQGIGLATCERLAYDASGQPLCGTLLDYLIPSAAESPRFVLAHRQTPSASPGGFRGVGEGGTIGAPAAVAGALAAALGGSAGDVLPLTPARLWEAAGGGGER